MTSKKSLRHCISNELAIKAERRVTEAQIDSMTNRIASRQGLAGSRRRRKRR